MSPIKCSKMCSGVVQGVFWNSLSTESTTWKPICPFFSFVLSLTSAPAGATDSLDSSSSSQLLRHKFSLCAASANEVVVTHVLPSILIKFKKKTKKKHGLLLLHEISHFFLVAGLLWWLIDRKLLHIYMMHLPRGYSWPWFRSEANSCAVSIFWLKVVQPQLLHLAAYESSI